MKVNRVAVILALLLAAGATRVRADAVDTFDISGTDPSSCMDVATGAPMSGCVPTLTDFSGTLTIDETTNTVVSVDLQSDQPVNGMAGCNSLLSPAGGVYGGIDPAGETYPGGVVLGALCNGGNVELFLDFSTPTPGSLAGFDGGTIFGGEIQDSSSVAYSYIDAGGSITPTPEPGSLALLLFGLAALALGASAAARSRA